MEKSKSITIIFLLAVGLLSSATPAKTVSVLLQEGLYAEEIEGDLDAAIKIYEQVISESKETQRAAAQATYRIGMCYLKKGEKANAAIQFSNLVSKFPDQKAIVEKARKQLAKLRPPTRVFEPQALDELIKSGKVPYFEVQLHDNTVLDLDSGEILALKEEWPDRFDVAWDNDGGGVLMKKAGSGVRFLALPSGGKQRWNDAISMARGDIDVLRNSNTRGIWASQGKFAAVLTNEGNLAVIQIGEYDANKGTIYGWVEKIPAVGFGPVMGRIIYTDETGKDCLFDLDTGKAFSLPKGLTRYSDPEKGIPWLLENGIDFLNCAGRLQLWDMVAVEVEEKMWDSAVAVEINSALMRGSSKEFLPTWRVEYTITTPRTYAFETREGGIGLLQILEKRSTYLRIRYKMLQEPAKITPVEVFGPVIKRVVYHGGTVHECLIDFESGKLFKVPEGLKDSRGKESEVLEWVKETGVDAAGDAEGPITSQGLQGFVNDLVAQPAADGWNTTPRELVATMGSLLPEPHVKARMFAKGALPATYFFKTRDGGMGVLQILGFTTGDPRGVKVRYKMLQQKLSEIETFIKEMHNPDAPRFVSLNKIIKIGQPAVKRLIAEIEKSNDWQIPKALGAIGDKRAVGPLIKKWQKCDWSPMKEVIAEALERITGKKLGLDKQKWDKWWQETKRFISPEATIQSFMAAAMKLDMNGAMVFVASDSHDYKDIKAIFEKPEHPFNSLFRKIDPSVPVKILETKIIDNMCEAVWQVTFKEDFTIEGKTFKAGGTFDIDGNLHRYGDKWLITGI